VGRNTHSYDELDSIGSVSWRIGFRTRKLYYRKDDRAMRPIYGCTENFGGLSDYANGYFIQNFMGFCSDGILPPERALMNSYKRSIHIIPLSALGCSKF